MTERSFSNEETTDVSTMKPEPRKENCRLEKVEVINDQHGDQLLFTFKDSHGAILRERIFEPKDATDNPPYEGYDFNKVCIQTQNRVAHILNRYIKEEETRKVSGKNWSEYCKNVVAAFPKGYNNITCVLKVVFNKGGYVSLPKFPDFISTKFSPKDFKVDPKYDYFEKSAEADKENDVKEEKEVF